MRLLSISDDDLCADCMRCQYRPGGESGCVAAVDSEWPAELNADGYAIACPLFLECLRGTNHALDAEESLS